MPNLTLPDSPFSTWRTRPDALIDELKPFVDQYVATEFTIKRHESHEVKARQEEVRARALSAEIDPTAAAEEIDRISRTSKTAVLIIQDRLWALFASEIRPRAVRLLAEFQRAHKELTTACDTIDKAFFAQYGCCTKLPEKVATLSDSIDKLSSMVEASAKGHRQSNVHQLMSHPLLARLGTKPDTPINEDASPICAAGQNQPTPESNAEPVSCSSVQPIAEATDDISEPESW